MKPSRRFAFGASFVLLVACGGNAPDARLPTTQGPASGSTNDPRASGEPRAATAARRPPMDTSYFKTFAQTRGFTLGLPTGAKLTPDGQAVLFLRSGPRSPKQTLFELRIGGGEAKEVLTPEQLVGAGPEVLTAEEKARRERMRVGATGFATFALDDAGTQVLVSVSGRPYVYNRSTQKSRPLAIGQGAAIDPRFSPDGKLVAYVRDFNLCVAPTDGGAEVAITKGGTEAKPFGLAEFIAQEELSRHEGYWWSPDSTQLLYQATDQSEVERLTIADPAHASAEPYRPFYPRPGKKNAEVRLGLIAAKGGSTTWVEWDRARFPYVAQVRWSKGGPPTVYVLDRLQRHGLLLAVDAKTGKTRTLLEEKDDAWLNVMPGAPQWLADGSGFLWASERSGQWALELRSAKDASVKALTSNVDVRRILHVDEKRRFVYFAGGTEPTETELLRVSLDGGAVEAVRKAEGGGIVDASFGRGDDAYIARVVPRDGEPTVAAYSIDGKSLAVLPSVAETPPKVRPVEITKVGKDELRVSIVRPASFEKGRKYPVIDAAYGGPHANLVEAPYRNYLKNQRLADALDAIVVGIDAKGTPRRGRAFERAIAFKFGEVPVEGHVEALKALGERYPEMDMARVGVTGWSYGGFYSVYALLARPDVYKVAVAGAPPVDWRDYDTAYTERYLGLPDGDAGAKVYDESSPLRFLSGKGPAPERRKLLILHGTADDNVFFLNALKLTDALDRAQYPYELMPLVGQTHRVHDVGLMEASDVRALEFFRQHL